MQSNIPSIFSHLATVPQTDFSLHSSISAIKNIKFHQISSCNKKAKIQKNSKDICKEFLKTFLPIDRLNYFLFKYFLSEKDRSSS